MKKITMKSDVQIEEEFKKGDALVVEDENCTARYLFSEDL